MILDLMPPLSFVRRTHMRVSLGSKSATKWRPLFEPSYYGRDGDCGGDGAVYFLTMVIPQFREDGWLPPGHHPITWEELIEVFDGESGSRREQILTRLILWRDRARSHGLTGRLLLDGSFISTKQEPGDFDGIFVGAEGTEDILVKNPEAQLLLNYLVCKEIYGGDLLFFSAAAIRKYPEFCRIDGFDYSKDQKPKGLVELIV